MTRLLKKKRKIRKRKQKQKTKERERERGGIPDGSTVTVDGVRRLWGYGGEGGGNRKGNERKGEGFWE